jgi:hypothetical protein
MVGSRDWLSATRKSSFTGLGTLPSTTLSIVDSTVKMKARNIALTTPATTADWKVDLLLRPSDLYAKFSITFFHSSTIIHATTMPNSASTRLSCERFLPPIAIYHPVHILPPLNHELKVSRPEVKA